MTERFNMAESFLKRLQTNLFMNIDKKHKKDMTCNTLFLKVKTGDINTYAVKEFNDITKDSVIRIPSHDETKFFENVVKLDGNSVCKYDVSHEFVEYYYDDCDFCFVLFSKTTPDYLRPRNNPSYSVCSLLFLKIIPNKTPPNDLYISLVCAESKSASEKSGMGSKLMTFVEDFARQGNLGKIVLSSLDTPIGFYSSKGFQPIKGSDMFEVPEEVKLSIFKRDGSLLHPELPKHALFVNSHGMTTSYNNATRLLSKNNPDTNLNDVIDGLTMDEPFTPRRSQRTTAGRKYLKDGKIGALKGVKVGEEMLLMYKQITPKSKSGFGNNQKQNTKKRVQGRRKKTLSKKKKRK